MKENKIAGATKVLLDIMYFCWNGCDADFTGVIQMVWNCDQSIFRRILYLDGADLHDGRCVRSADSKRASEDVSDGACG